MIESALLLIALAFLVAFTPYLAKQVAGMLVTVAVVVRNAAPIFSPGFTGWIRRAESFLAKSHYLARI
jgi:hypothetical protein